MIEILMATYNGGRYIEDQLKSISDQTYKQIKITIRDDGSTDDTLEIVRRFQHLNGIDIVILEDDKGRLGSTKSFEALLANATGQLIMFCDQDDVWLEHKVEKTLALMENLIHRNPSLPLMVFTDLKEVDTSLNIISESFIRNQKLYPGICDDPVKLLALNVVAGCTMMLNRTALPFVLPFPSGNVVHDQWIAVNVAKYGKIAYLDEPTILYRQHNNNAVGANNIGIKYFMNKVFNPVKQVSIYKNLIKNLRFKVFVPKFLYYKTFFTIKRLFL